MDRPKPPVDARAAGFASSSRRLVSPPSYLQVNAKCRRQDTLRQDTLAPPMAPPEERNESLRAESRRKDPACQALIEALRGANRGIHHALRLYSTDGVYHTIDDLRKLRESALISLCAALGTPDDEALCCARLILGPKSSATEATTIDGLLRGTYRSDITSDRLSGAGHTLQSLKERLQSRSFGREQLTALLSGLVLDIARDGVVRLLMASAGRDADAIETSLRPVVFATTSSRTPSQPVVFATTAPTPAPPPQLSDGERLALTAREQSRVLLALRLLRDELGGRCELSDLCSAIYAADAKARSHFAKWFGGAMKWFEQFPDVFSCVMVGTAQMVTFTTGNDIKEAATDGGPTDGAAASSSDAVAPSSAQPESQVAFEEPITDISLRHTTGGASQMVFTAGGDIFLPPSVVEDFGYTSSDMVKASDVRTPS